jgi:hypothetical protein
MSAKTLTLKYYTDPGHGWVAVKRHYLIGANIQDRVSAYSYQRGDTVYLEEDCDAALLLDAMRAAGIVVNLVRKHTDRRHAIRSYDSYVA